MLLTNIEVVLFESYDFLAVNIVFVIQLNTMHWVYNIFRQGRCFQNILPVHICSHRPIQLFSYLII